MISISLDQKSNKVIVHRSQDFTRSVQTHPSLRGLCCTMHSQWGRKTTKIASSPWDFVTLMEGDRLSHDHSTTGNMHKNLRSCHSVDILAYRQTDRQTDSTRTRTRTRSLQYFPYNKSNQISNQWPNNNQ